VFDEVVGNTDNLLLVRMRAIKMAKIDIQHHINRSCEGECVPLKFIEEEHEPYNSQISEADTLYHRYDVKENCPKRLYEESILYL
jgi:hypothetical protein